MLWMGGFVSVTDLVKTFVLHCFNQDGWVFSFTSLVGTVVLYCCDQDGWGIQYYKPGRNC